MVRGFAHRLADLARKVCASAKSGRVLLATRPSHYDEAASGLFLMFWAFVGVALSFRWLALAMLERFNNRLIGWPL